MSRRPAARHLLALVTALTLLAAAAGCGGGASDGAEDRLTVSAAVTLREAFEAYAQELDGPSVRFSFAGSGELAARIRRGVRPDVYAAADARLPEQLFEEGLVEAPVAFARNRLVVAVAPGPDQVSSLADLAEPGVDLAIGAESVPVGDYARRALAGLEGSRRDRILANVRSTEPSVAGVIAKVRQGAADAGFVYATDALAARLEVMELPEDLQPAVEHAAAVVVGAPNPDGARAFLDGLLKGAGRRALSGAGFRPPQR